MEMFEDDVESLHFFRVFLVELVEVANHFFDQNISRRILSPSPGLDLEMFLLVAEIVFEGGPSRDSFWWIKLIEIADLHVEVSMETD